MLASLIVGMSLSAPVSALQDVPDYTQCPWVRTAPPPRPARLVRLLRRQGLTLSFARSTRLTRIGEIGAYSLYHYVHVTPAGSCHQLEAVIILKESRYVGSYTDIGPAACRVRRNVLTCRDVIDRRDYSVVFAQGVPPRDALLGGRVQTLRK